MSSFYFFYSAMNAGKSTSLLQTDHNYIERGMQTLLFTCEADIRYKKGEIASRIGLHKEAISFDKNLNFFDYIKEKENISCVLIDEAQFLTAKQVDQLGDVVDLLDIPVLAYGIRTDFMGNLFEGSARLLAVADILTELKTVCYCGRKAIMNMRIDKDGKKITEGEQVDIGGNEKYISVCRKHFKNPIIKKF